MLASLSLLVLLASPDTLFNGMQVIPLWERTTCGNETKACYSFDKAQELYKLDLKLQFELKKSELLEQSAKSFQEAITKFDQIDYVNQKTINNLQDMLRENQKILGELKKENLDLQEPKFFARWEVLTVGAIVMLVTGAALGYWL